jgi:hypothetical protein
MASYFMELLKDFPPEDGFPRPPDYKQEDTGVAFADMTMYITTQINWMLGDLMSRIPIDYEAIWSRDPQGYDALCMFHEFLRQYALHTSEFLQCWTGLQGESLLQYLDEDTLNNWNASVDFLDECRRAQG